ncbi:hypothetical protein MNBD_GAMMA03-686 [hydrothermal vent metagenome]|uniref:STAS domain-containing protein n=1 Tax=hydrothermal vent metagenome TaxID=652676 RepID=A0A3B0VUB2_9ZZZZ
MPKLEWCEKSSVMKLPSVVTLETLPELLKQSKSILLLPVKWVDFSLVQQADSAVLALLLIWSKNSSPPLKALELPDSLQNLITLYDLESIIIIDNK